MRKATRDRQVLKGVKYDPKYWDFYRDLDAHVKREFAFEIMNRLGWTKSTFYRRMSEGYNWSQDELRFVNMTYSNYKRIYG